VVRFVIHPKPFGDETNDHPGWLGTEPDFYFNEILDPAVMHAVKRGLYVVLDWHYVYANCESEEIINTTNDFWNYIAPRYANLANVIFDIINEPGTPGDWNSYQPIAQKWVDLIRFHAPLNLILIGGPNYARVLPMPRPSNPEELINPIEANNIIYVCHIYPGVQPNQSASSWEQLFGGLADVAPLMISEWGWEYLAPSPCTGLKSTWGAPFKEYVDSKENVGWIAWIFDQFWRPVMFDENWNLLGGDEYMGESIKQWLYEKKDVYHFQME
jgi:hypothetical protein